jgi:hypothetical protein
LGQLDGQCGIGGRGQMGQNQHAHTCSGGDLTRLPRCDMERRVLGQRSDLAEEEVRAVGKAVDRFGRPAVSRVREGVTWRADTQAVGLEAMLDRDRLDDDLASPDLNAVPELVG